MTPRNTSELITTYEQIKLMFKQTDPNDMDKRDALWERMQACKEEGYEVNF